MEPLGSIGSIPPKAAGFSHPTASAGKTVMLLSAKLIENLPGKTALCFLPPAGQLLGRERVEGACRERPSPRHRWDVWSRAPPGTGAVAGRRWALAATALPAAAHLVPVSGSPAVQLRNLGSHLPGREVGSRNPSRRARGGKQGREWEEGVGRSGGF